jgi:hypothetical protein
MHFGYKKKKRVVIMVVLREADTKEVPEVDMCVVADEDMEEGEEDPPLVSIVERLVMYQGFVPNHACFVHIVIALSMSQRTVPT